MTEAVKLRKIEDADRYLLVRWRNENARCFGHRERLTLPQHLRWYRRYLYDPGDHMYMVEYGGLAVGTIGISMRTREIQRVLLGDKAAARRGVMSAALRLLMEAYGPGTYWLRVLPDNERAVAFYQKNGFTREPAYYTAGAEGPQFTTMSRRWP